MTARPVRPTDKAILFRQMAQRAHPDASKARQPTTITHRKGTVISTSTTGVTVRFPDTAGGFPTNVDVAHLPTSVPAFAGDVVLVAKQGGVWWVTQVLARDYSMHGLAALGYSGGWADAAGGVPGAWYIDASNICHLRGQLAPPSASGTSTVTALPVAPIGTAGWSLATNAAPVTAFITAGGAFDVINPGGLTLLYLDGVAFPVGR